MSSELLAGLTVPPRLGQGKPSQEAIEPWLEVVGQLMGRGVQTPSAMRSVLGIGYRTASNWMGEVRRRWASGLSDELVNHRRESLYAEADEVARQSWLEAMNAETPSEKASLFKVVLMANQRKAALTGLDALEVRIHKRVESRSTIELVASVEQQHGLAPGALEQLGRNAAILMSPGQQLPAPEIIEVEAE